MTVDSSISIENARLVFRNFSGKEGKYNPEGRRNFCVLLEEDIAKSLKKDGWNIRWLEPKDPEDEKQAYIQIAVAFGRISPRIILISGGIRSTLEEGTVNVLDWAEIETADLIIRPYNWEVGPNKGVKAYLKTAYITIKEDEFAHKYRDVPDAGATLQSDEDPPWTV